MNDDSRPPEEAAADDSNQIAEAPAQPSHKDRLKALFHKLDLHWPPGRKELIIIAVLIIGLGGGIMALTANGKTPLASKSKKTSKPAPAPIVSKLSGLEVSPQVLDRPVTGIMIENSMDARPQSGLSEASVVFEAIAEGGITRFLALYQDNVPGDVGPIRSARPYYLEWLAAFDAGYAHVGGSPEALANIKLLGLKDLDQFANSGSYHRISGRAAPHNVYTSLGALIQLQINKGWAHSNYTGFARKKAAPAKVPPVKTVDLNLSGALYNVHYDYNVASNTYNRVEGGAAHMDANGNRQISPNVIVAMVVPYAIASDGHHSDYQVNGSGQAYIFQDGYLAIGGWAKKSGGTQITFTDAAGKPLGLNPGQTWLTAVDSAAKVTYGP